MSMAAEQEKENWTGSRGSDFQDQLDCWLYDFSHLETSLNISVLICKMRHLDYVIAKVLSSANTS
jgi:hypothetical protein